SRQHAKEGTGVRPARSTIGLAVLILLSSLGLSACNEDERWNRTARSADGGQVSQIRPASQTVSDRQRDRRRDRRDRTSRRSGRGGVELLPHFADYAVHETGFSTTRFKRAHGMLTIELIDDCGDWTLQEKWDLDLRDQTDQSHQSNLLYRASEVRSADKFVFAYSRDHLGERTDFIGDVLAVDGGFMARFREPKIPDLFLSPDLAFPIGHLRQILSEARRQRDGFETTVFDGGNAIPYRAVTTISLPLRADDTNPRVVAARTELDRKKSDRLPDGRHWPVRTEYFPLEDAYAPPVFTREFLLHESGIVLSFHFDYGDIQMDARLKTLDIRKAKPCPG
ncbi:MAG: cell envelope integrity EipB family protein, partial [Alphaproteobacteria bacterium]|nr:cell envelope integrity EipB family protein [Alphaproteobacteria bacterium]